MTETMQLVHYLQTIKPKELQINVCKDFAKGDDPELREAAKTVLEETEGNKEESNEVRL